MSKLNQNIEDNIRRRKGKVDKNVDLKTIFLFLSMGFQVILIYMFFIYLVGDLLAKLLHLNNLYFLAIILGTIANINSIIKMIKGVYMRGIRAGIFPAFIFLLLIGFTMGLFNFLGLKITLKKFVETKKISIIMLSFFTRITLICIVFYLFLNKSWTNAVFMIIGFIIAKYSIILFDKVKGAKK